MLLAEITRRLYDEDPDRRTWKALKLAERRVLSAIAREAALVAEVPDEPDPQEIAQRWDIELPEG